MAFEKAYQYLETRGFADRVMTFTVSSATVDLAAVAVGTEPARIAKSLTFLVDGAPVMILCAEDTKIANSKYKAFFHCKAKMMTREEVAARIGHEVGGVCPFGIPQDVKVYLDTSLERFEFVYPACGNDASAVRLTCAELETLSGSLGWIDVCDIRGAE